MKLYGVLVLLVTLSAAYGLQCYVCENAKPTACTQTKNCTAGHDHCGSTVTGDLVTKKCRSNAECKDTVKCCDKDLCNGAIPTSSSVLLLLVSSAITSVFL